jgi:hypothetical protein
MHSPGVKLPEGHLVPYKRDSIENLLHSHSAESTFLTALKFDHKCHQPHFLSQATPPLCEACPRVDVSQQPQSVTIQKCKRGWRQIRQINILNMIHLLLQ